MRGGRVIFLSQGNHITMRSKLIAHLWVAALLVPGMLIGCGSDPKPAGSPAVPAASGRLFGVTVQTMNNPFFLDLEQGLKGVIEAHGDRLVMLDAQFNSLKQKNDISDLLQQQPAALFINPVNWEGVRGSLIEAKRQERAGDHRGRPGERP